MITSEGREGEDDEKGRERSKSASEEMNKDAVKYNIKLLLPYSEKHKIRKNKLRRESKNNN